MKKRIVSYSEDGKKKIGLVIIVLLVVGGVVFLTNKKYLKFSFLNNEKVELKQTALNTKIKEGIYITDVSEVVENAMPSIVSITSKTLIQSGNYYPFNYGSTQQYVEGAGSGIIVSQSDDELLILTNNHVVADSSELTLKFINDKTISLWVLDIMLPGVVSGYDILKQIRSVNTKIPVIFTSARDQDIDRVMGLELGSDDYLSKPYSIRDLMLRIKNIITRTYGKEDNVGNVEEINGYVVDFDKRIVTENGVNINLTSKEYDLLFFLLQNKTKAFSRDQILDQVWGSDYYGSDRVVDDLMRRLRQKMPNLSVETIYGFGYRLV